MITVKLIHERSGEPWNGQPVSVSIDGFFSGGYTEKKYTNSLGEADFDEVKPGRGKVYVGNRTVYEGELTGRTVVYA